MNISRFSPNPRLNPYIREYIIIESDTDLSNTMIPDTSMAMAIRFKGSTAFTTAAGIDTLPSGVISGLRNIARTVSYSKGTGNLITVFKEGGVAAFCAQPAHELFNQSISADNIFTAASIRDLTEKISGASSHTIRIRQLEQFLESALQDSPSDLLINHAVEIIQKQKGIIRVKELAASLYISQDPFEKKFRTRIGCSPKKFAAIIRIRNLINNFSSYDSLTEATYEAGFYDQSHFIKEFRQFTGKSPSAFFAAPQIW